LAGNDGSYGVDLPAASACWPGVWRRQVLTAGELKLSSASLDQ